ncbi:MAG: hypothetical protein ACK40M_13545, partial [Flavobacteriales bacterium]
PYFLPDKQENRVWHAEDEFGRQFRLFVHYDVSHLLIRVWEETIEYINVEVDWTKKDPLGKLKKINKNPRKKLRRELKIHW